MLCVSLSSELKQVSVALSHAHMGVGHMCQLLAFLLSELRSESTQVMGELCDDAHPELTVSRQSHDLCCVASDHGWTQ